MTSNGSLALSKLDLSRMLESINSGKVKLENNSVVNSEIELLDQAYNRYRTAIESLDDLTVSKNLADYSSFSEEYFSARRKLVRVLSSIKSDKKHSIEDILEKQSEILLQISQSAKKSDNEAVSSMTVKLPTLNIPKFNGSFRDWPNFRDQFVASIDSNVDLSKCRKLQYLKSLLTDDALSVIKSVALSDDNYDPAWRLLQERFNQPQLLTHSIIEHFINCKSVSQDKANLKALTLTLSESLELLAAQGPYASSRDPWVNYLVISKLDKDTKNEWAKESALNNTPSTPQLLGFLRKQCAILDLNPETNLKRDPKPILRVNNSITYKCQYCKEAHVIHKCVKFLNLSIDQREKYINKENRCFNCFGCGHSVKNCKSVHTCYICKRKHHTLLHRQPGGSSRSDLGDDSSPNQHDNKIISINLSRDHVSDTLLPTALVYTFDQLGDPLNVRVLLDSGAQCSFICESVVRRLNLKVSQQRISFKPFSTSSASYSRGSVKLILYSQFNPDLKLEVTAHVVPTVISSYPCSDLSFSCNKTLHEQFNLADPGFFKSSEVHMILSASIFFSLLKPKKFLHTEDNLFIQSTALGYILCSSDESNSSNFVNISLDSHDIASLDKTLERFWEVEEPPTIKNSPSIEESECEKFFESTTTRRLSGRFCVKLPFKENPKKLGNSLIPAKRRFSYLEKKLSNDSLLRTEYLKFMSEYERLGHMTKTSLSFDDLKIGEYYLIPHHGIWQGEKPNRKLRVVFDASARCDNGVSLNDILFIGQPLQNDITDVLGRFRQYRYVLTADIEKMYRQIDVDDDDRKYQLILWRSADDLPVSIYRLNTVTYGQSCSPYLALKVVDTIIKENNARYPQACGVLRECRFVDDILFGSNTISDLIAIKRELIDLLSEYCLKLKKWSSNDPELLRDIPIDHLTSTVNIDFSSPSELSLKTLGLTWLPFDDSFTFRIGLPNLDKFTKRSLLSDASRLFDPMGWLSPVILGFKILFQETWARQLDWDGSLPEDLKNLWLRQRSGLALLTSIRIPRFVGPEVFELHGFSDASKHAYAAAIYSRSKHKDGSIQTALLISKTKLAPLKQVSIPRLELSAAHLLARLVSHVRNLFDIPSSSITLWSDSTITLSWIKSLPRKWSTYVGNRVGEIQSLCPGIRWLHVDTKNNPADLASRGASVNDIIQSRLWWEGPEFLKTSKISIHQPEILQTNEEARPQHVFAIERPNDFFPKFTERFSSLTRAINVLSYLLRVKNRLKSAPSLKEIVLTATETSRSLSLLIRGNQKYYYPTEFTRLLDSRPIHNNSSLKSFTPFLNDEQLICVGGRLHAIDSSDFTSHPILIPTSHLAKLLVRKAHVDTYHGGFQVTSSRIRENYWVVGLSRLVKSCIKSCICCLRYSARTYQPLLGSLPEERLVPSKPFLKIGIDFAGPILVRPVRNRGNLTKKSYIALFVCLVTKAIHLELVMGLDTDSLILALQRFSDRRGKCSYIVSDNGRNFVGAKRVISDFQRSLSSIVSSDSVKTYLATEMICWEFIPPYSPNFGGLWEANIKSTKRHLVRMFNGSVLTLEEMTTALCRIENILNSRPLYPISFSSFLKPLTPNDILIGKQGSHTVLSDESLNSSNRLKFLKDLISNFWHRWRQEYLDTLMKRTKWKNKSEGPKLNDIVLIKRNNDPPKTWSLGRITKCHFGPDGVCRVVDLITSQGDRREAVSRIIPLHLDANASTGAVCFEQIS